MNFKFQKAFTLIELSVVLFIISLLMVGLLGPVGTQIESQERQQTSDTMDDIIESLYGFAVINGYLPCPDTDGDGLSNGGPGTCTDASGDGWLPWQTLGINVQSDIWGNRFKYHVTTPGFTTIDDGTCGDGTGGTNSDLDLCQDGTITVLTRGDDNTTAGVIENKFQSNAATLIPAIVISHGRNGLGATTVNSVSLPATTAGTDEAENDDADTDNIFYSRIFSEGSEDCTDDTDETNPLCDFDDMVRWISPNILKNRMVKAEKLP
jgi:prepilin-type N-terminal cleavage/methylation domain-containing protein